MQTFTYKLIDGHLLVTHSNNTFLIDTGAPASVSKNTYLTFAGKEYTVQRNYMGLTINSLCERIGTDLDSLIGVDILADYCMVIDPRTNELTLSNEEEFNLEGVPLSLELFMGIPIIKVTINNKKCKMFFDTGAKLSYLNPDVTEKYPNLGLTQDFYPGVGSFQTNTYNIQIKLGDEEIELKVGNLPGILQQTLILASTVGILGTAVLSNFVIGLSLKQKIIILKKIKPKNPFEAMCQLASAENWCWRIFCTTCGHMYFRYAFRELANGVHPDTANWIPRTSQHNQMGEKLGSMPTLDNFKIEEQSNLVAILQKSSLKNISRHCKFPDWLGYLGLALMYTSKYEQESRILTNLWIPQLLDILSNTSSSRSYFEELCSNSEKILTWQDLERIETDLLLK